MAVGGGGEGVLPQCRVGYVCPGGVSAPVHAGICLPAGGGGSAPVHAGIHPPCEQND